MTELNVPPREKNFVLWRKQTTIWIYIFFVALLATSCTAPAPTQPAKATAVARNEILWDSWGIPHIYGIDAAGLFHGFGWAQAQSHGNLILRLYGHARGRAAEYWGGDYLDSDRWVRTMGVPRRAEEWYQAQSPEFRNYLDAFVAGINDYAKEHPDQISDDVKVVLPVKATDIIAHGQRVTHFTFVVNSGSVKSQAKDWHPDGSNAWAIAPSHSESGHALLLANPHLRWADFYLWYEAHFIAPGVNLYGATLVGSPLLSIAFNDYLGWTHTVNTLDGADLYELTLMDGGYRWDGGVRKFEREEQTLKVKQKDGSLQEEKLVVRRSIHGPVVEEKNGKALALRVVGLDQPYSAQQYWDMGRARNLAEFEAAEKRLQNPMFTVMYADRDGHIMHLFGGRTPVRPKGNYNWARIVPGDTSVTLWTSTHPYEELPRVVDPSTGWLQNANDPPWTTTFPPALDANNFPSYMAPRFMHFRAQRSARMLMEDPRISFEKLVRYKHSTRMELADRILDDLSSAVQQHGGEKAKRAIVVLESWDRCADAESRGAVLFEAFFKELTQRAGKGGPFAVPWNEKSPLKTPGGLADPAMAVAALEAAADKVQADHGSLDVAWGKVYHLIIDKVDLPANGGPSDLGIFRAAYFGRTNGGPMQIAGGDSYVAAIEFSNPVRAKALIGYGNSSQPGSPHRTDQLPLFARKELRPVWRTRQEIEAHLESRKVF
jgi:acyl-homoserine-lactone acylase